MVMLPLTNLLCSSCQTDFTELVLVDGISIPTIHHQIFCMAVADRTVLIMTNVVIRFKAGNGSSHFKICVL